MAPSEVQSLRGFCGRGRLSATSFILDNGRNDTT